MRRNLDTSLTSAPVGTMFLVGVVLSASPGPVTPVTRAPHPDLVNLLSLGSGVFGDARSGSADWENCELGATIKGRIGEKRNEGQNF